MTPDQPTAEQVADEPIRVTPSGRTIPDSLAGAESDLKTCLPVFRGELLESLAHAATLPLADEVEVGRPHCQRCEVLPRPLTGPGTLHLSLPHTHSLGKVVAWLTRTHRPHALDRGTVGITIKGDADADGLAELMLELRHLLAVTERRDSRAFFQHAGDELRPSDFFQVESLLTLEAQEAAGWLLQLLRAGQITSHFQPLVDCRTRACYGYECLMRGHQGGGVVSPGRMIESARQAGLVFQLDMAGRRAAVLAACRHRLQEKVFINFTPNAIYDPTHCLLSTVRMIDAGGLRREQVVFEVTEAEKLPDVDHLRKIVNYYRDMGFAVALDDVGAGYSSLNMVLDLRPDYVKIDRHLIHGVHDDPSKAVVAGKLLETAQELGLKTVAEGVETEAEWDWVRGHHADFAQGYYFARPAAVPPVPART